MRSIAAWFQAGRISSCGDRIQRVAEITSDRLRAIRRKGELKITPSLLSSTLVNRACPAPYSIRKAPIIEPPTATYHTGPRNIVPTKDARATQTTYEIA